MARSYEIRMFLWFAPVLQKYNTFSKKLLLSLRTFPTRG